jgi:hypothetical protein
MKSAYLLGDRGVGKTFSACLCLANLIMNAPSGCEVALCGVQMIHATNLLATISAIMDMNDGKKVFDRLPNTGVEKMMFWRNGKQTMVRCYPGKGKSFRGNNKVKCILLDNMFNYTKFESIMEFVQRKCNLFDTQYSFKKMRKGANEKKTMVENRGRM